MKKKDQEIINDYLIDYDMFSVDEIVKIISFMKLIEDTKRKKVNKDNKDNKLFLFKMTFI